MGLTTYLDETGSYNGFDVVLEGIDWCNNKIARNHENFNFIHVSLNNDLYTTKGASAVRFVFPYANNTFDKVFTFSVYTHMQVDEISNYLKETRRTLKSEGFCFSTFFLYNDSNEKHIASQKDFNFPVRGDGFRLMNANTINGNIAIHENLLENITSNAGFNIEKIVHGRWKQRSGHDDLEYQDIVILSVKT